MIKLIATLARPETVRNIRGLLESPDERKALAIKLYTRFAGIPTNTARMYCVASGRRVSGVPIHISIVSAVKNPITPSAIPQTKDITAAVCTYFLTSSGLFAPIFCATQMPTPTERPRKKFMNSENNDPQAPTAPIANEPFGAKFATTIMSAAL